MDQHDYRKTVVPYGEKLLIVYLGETNVYYLLVCDLWDLFEFVFPCE